MDTLTHLKKYEGFTLPKTFKPFIEFYVSVAGGICDGFHLIAEDEKHMLKSYATEPEFLASFMKIAQSDFGGGEYLFWLKEAKDLTKAPIVCFGGEGGYQIVANNFNELLQILTYDVETIGIDWDSVSYYKDKDEFSPSKNADAFSKWIKSTLGVDAIDTEEQIEQIVQNAQNQHQGALEKWVHQFYEA